MNLGITIFIVYCMFMTAYSYLSNLRYIDHGDGLLALRIIDPFVFDTGRYTCLVHTSQGKCQTSGMVTVTEVITGNRNDVNLATIFVKHPVPVVAIENSTASFCARVMPVTAEVTWSVCGRRVTDGNPGIVVSNSQLISD